MIASCSLRCLLVVLLRGEDLAAAEGHEPLERGGVGRGLGLGRERVAVAHLRLHELASEGIDLGDEVVGRLVGKTGGPGQIPAVDETVERGVAGERCDRHLAEGGGDRPLLSARRVQRAQQLGHGSAPPIGELPFKGRSGPRCLATEGRREVGGTTDHVLQDARHREVGARRRVVELVGPDLLDHRLDQGDDLVELLDTVHGFSLVAGSRRRGDRLAVSAEHDQVGDRLGAGVVLVTIGHEGILRCATGPGIGQIGHHPGEEWRDLPTRRRWAGSWAVWPMRHCSWAPHDQCQSGWITPALTG